MRWVCVLLLSAFLLIGCSATTSKQEGQTPDSNPFEHPRTTSPITSNTPDSPKRTCKTNADCVVKNVGNCCGQYPACVAKDAKVDAAAVQARCAKEGRVSVCGFPVISACTCNEGVCQAVNGAVQ